MLQQDEKKIRDGMAGLQKAMDSIDRSLENRNLDPQARAVLEQAQKVAKELLEMAGRTLDRLPQ